MLTARTNIISLEQRSNNETIVAEPFSEYNGNWIEALRAKRANNSDRLEQMQESIIVTAETEDEDE